MCPGETKAARAGQAIVVMTLTTTATTLTSAGPTGGDGNGRSGSGFGPASPIGLASAIGPGDLEDVNGGGEGDVGRSRFRLRGDHERCLLDAGDAEGVGSSSALTITW